ncbi:MAG TPA: hypothetical protein VNS60_14510 [Solirubrobacterales bacterium]|nr:hypothetical protein [Solirubrobacterales bacterium]
MWNVVVVEEPCSGRQRAARLRQGSESPPPRSDVYRIDILPSGAVGVAAEETQKLTTDRRSFNAWSANGSSCQPSSAARRDLRGTVDPRAGAERPLTNESSGRAEDQTIQ